MVNKKELKPRYVIATITTTDIETVEQSHYVRDFGNTHEAIYKAGLDALEKLHEQIKKDT